MLSMAVPRFVASLYALYPEAVFGRQKKLQTPLSAETYRQSIGYLDHALDWHETGDYWQMRAIFELSQSAEAQTRQLSLAQEATRNGLRLSPVDPYAWLRLASIDNLRQAGSHQVLEHLRLSIYAGPVEPELFAPRLLLALKYQDALDDELRALVAGQIRSAWALKPKDLLELGVAHPSLLIFAQQALPGDAWERFRLDFEKRVQ